MKHCSKGSIQWMVIGALLAVMALFASASLADEAHQALSSAYPLSRNAQQITTTDARQCSDDVPAYLQKKLAYYRFIDRYIENRKKELGAEGISVSIISKNDLLFLKGYGYADKETQQPVTPLSLFGIGSVSKLFTGIAIMQLVEQGRIDLDAPLENYIPDFGYKTHFPAAGPLTVRTLMTHQSGLVGEILKGSCSIFGPEHHFRELVDDLKEEYLAYPPGYISAYGNCAVALLGIVIEEVSGVEFKTYIQNNICRPLGMVASNFSLRDYMVPLLAKSYDSAGVESPFVYYRDEPAVSFISNALEMSLFMRMILNGGTLFGRRILKQATLEQMFVQQNSNVELDFPDDHGLKWGLSWLLFWPSLAYAGQYVGHTGGILHYYTQMHILPEHGLAVIVQTNSSPGAQLSADVADMAMIKALEMFKGITRPNPDPLPPMVPLTQDHVVQTVGTYATNDLGLLSIYPKQAGLFASCTELGAIEMELLPHEDNWFSLYLNDQPAPGFENIRITVQNGARERFVGMQSRDTSGKIISKTIGSEYEIPDDLSQAWLNRTGQYRIINPDPYMQINSHALIQALPSGVLYNTITAYTASVLDPIYEDEAIRTGRGGSRNETIQVVDCDGAECLYYLGYLFKKQSDIKAAPETQQTLNASDLQKKGQAIENRLLNQFYFHGLNY